MLITSLHLGQVRGYEQAEFSFQPGMNLLVGINGVGKSTTLDALRIMLGYALPRLTGIRMRAKSFEANDITNDRGALTAELSFEIADQTLNSLIHQPREQYVSTGEEGAVREQAYDLIERRDLAYLDALGVPHPIESRNDIPKSMTTAKVQPLAVYFQPAARSSVKQKAIRANAAPVDRRLHMPRRCERASCVFENLLTGGWFKKNLAPASG